MWAVGSGQWAVGSGQKSIFLALLSMVFLSFDFTANQTLTTSNHFSAQKKRSRSPVFSNLDT